MGLFDSLFRAAGNEVKQAASSAATSAVNNAAQSVQQAASTTSKSFTFASIPTTVDEFLALPEAQMTDPFAVGALTVLALNVYVLNAQAGIDMLNALKGPTPLSNLELQMLKEHMRDYLARSYFKGATPDNNYEPTRPYTVEIIQMAHSNDQLGEGYKILYVRSGGADSPREIKFREKKSTSQWFLWEQFLNSGIRQPKAADPWA